MPAAGTRPIMTATHPAANDPAATVHASAVLVGENFYATNEAGKTFIFKANPEKFESVAENQLAKETLATPTFCGSRIYIRAALMIDGQRQEMLYCVGSEK